MVTRIISAARRAAANRIEFLLSTFLVAWSESSSALSMLFIGMYPLLHLNSVLLLYLGSCQRISRTTRLLSVWLHDATTDRMPESGIMVQPEFVEINYEELCDTNPSKTTCAPWHAR